MQVYYIHSFLLSFLNANVFSSLHDESFETYEKNSCRIDELIALQHDLLTGVIANVIGNPFFFF